MQNQLVLLSKKPKVNILFYVWLIIPIIIIFLLYMFLSIFRWFSLVTYLIVAGILLFIIYSVLFVKYKIRKRSIFKLVVTDDTISYFEMKKEKGKLLNEFAIKQLKVITYNRRHLEKRIIKKGKELKVSYICEPSFILTFNVKGEDTMLYLPKRHFDKESIELLSSMCKNSNDKIKVKI